MPSPLRLVHPLLTRLFAGGTRTMLHIGFSSTETLWLALRHTCHVRVSLQDSIGPTLSDMGCYFCLGSWGFSRLQLWVIGSRMPCICTYICPCCRDCVPSNLFLPISYPLLVYFPICIHFSFPTFNILRIWVLNLLFLSQLCVYYRVYLVIFTSLYKWKNYIPNWNIKVSIPCMCMCV